MFQNQRLTPAPIGTAGWSIPRALGEALPGEETHLQRYARRLCVAEINSSFYRPHRRSTYERWAASVPITFRFAYKLPKTITHQRKLVDCSEQLEAFAADVAGLGSMRGPALVQLPPSLTFDRELACAFFEDAIRYLGAGMVCEPRHASWFEAEPDHLLRDLGVARVAADPAIHPAAAVPGGWPGLVYFRLHGSPVVYRSPYEQEVLARQRRHILDARDRGVACWTIFDNTASGAALANALDLAEQTDLTAQHPAS
jgi:uncharacterized protein YecE (DUF72 family)